MNVQAFRDLCPEFMDITEYPDAIVGFWLEDAANSLPAARWRNWLTKGLLFYTAHNLVLAKQRQRAVQAGGVPGSAAGLVSSKAVDKVSVSYDTTTGSMKDAGVWNLTSYGQQFLALRNIVGARPVQL